MNIHSQYVTRTMVGLPPDRPGHDEQGDRRGAILDAAERCFVRAGFHRTTMQDIATDAGMSPGNIYRYFQSKDEVIAGMVDRHRTNMSRDFEPLERADDLAAAFMHGVEEHFRTFPLAKAILCMEVWAEATHNPVVRRINADFEDDVSGRMKAIIVEALARGQIPPEVDPEAVAVVTSLLADGWFVRRALVPDFDPERDVRHVFAVVEALLRGLVRSTDSMPQKG